MAESDWLLFNEHRYVCADDAACRGVRQLRLHLSACALLWMLAFVLFMVHMATEGAVVYYRVFIFVPMWLGSLWGLASIVLALQPLFLSTHLMTHEQRELCRESGIHTPHAIEYRSLPMIRRLLFWCISAFIELSLILTSQIFFYLWVVLHIIGMWHALVPAILSYISMLCYLFVNNSVSSKSCACFLLLGMGMVSHAHLVEKMNRQCTGIAGGVYAEGLWWWWW